jgi:hypothetical protein
MTDRLGSYVSHAVRFHIKPRYAPGSPGVVREQQAQIVLRRERDAYEDMLAGNCGNIKQVYAQDKGLRGIVEERWEFRGKQLFRDLLTGDTGLVPEEPRPKMGLFEYYHATRLDHPYEQSIKITADYHGITEDEVKKRLGHDKRRWGQQEG